MGSAIENKEIVNGFLKNNLIQDKFVIDLGCGKGVRMDYIRKNISKYILGIEIFEDYIKECLNKNHLVIKYDIIEFLEFTSDMFLKGNISPKYQFLMIDVLEHIKKENAIKCIEYMKNCGINILIFSPLGYIPQEEYDGNSYQKHLSSWEEKELIDLGFNTIVVKNFHEGLPSEWSTDVVFANWNNIGF